ncbi:MAG: amidohydrolase family protein [Chloroflexi bacterium]|jgi:N-acetylglucosamine-6-phosphate deacetylase|nr:amidohydrolase family protein [Chloroflexota bacterium]
MLITHATVVGLDCLLPDYAVRFQDGLVVEVAPTGELAAAPGEEVFDAEGRYLAPGYVDLHIHGTGHYLIDNGPDDLAALCRLLPRYGVTSFMPTVCPLPPGEDAALVASLASVRSEGTQILGLHLEGPFLTLTGALPPEAIGSADPERVRALIAAAQPRRPVFSVAPDFPGLAELLPLMAANDTPVFMTHTAANVRQTQAAIEGGVRHATHFYDVYPVPPETDPGVRPCGAVEAVLADPRVTVDFILDGVHVDPVAVQMALACKGPGGVCLITDANVGAGLAPGRYGFGAEEVEFACEGGPARLTERSRQPGTLAGSGLTLDRAVRNAVDLLGVSVPQAVRMASANPARVLGLERVKGQVRPGYDADLILLDAGLRVLRTWVRGQSVY